MLFRSNVPTAATLDEYHTAIGRDYYTFSEGEIFGVVLDSSLLRSPEGDPEAARQQEEWLDKTLASAKSNSKQQVVIFQHIPYFVQSSDEAESYFNIPMPGRRKYLDTLEKGGVRYVFAGHTHKSAIGTDGPLTEIITGAVGMPLGGSSSGLRIVTVSGQRLNSNWYCFGGIPNQIDSQARSSTP